MATENTTSIAHNTVTVDTTTTGGEVIAAARGGRGGGLLLQNLSATVDVYIGGTGVTTSNGIKLAAGASISFDSYSGAVYGVVASGSADVRYMETY